MLVEMRKQLAQLSGYDVNIVISQENIRFKFFFDVYPVGSKIKTKQQYGISIPTHSELTVLDVSEMVNRAKIGVSEYLKDHAKGNTGINCCNDSNHSSGWHHHTKCPNYVLKY